MAALDFPDSPTIGQVYDKWTWNGTLWTLTSGAGGGGGSGFTFAQDTTPTATAEKQTWFQTSTGDSFIWTNDGTSTQWVQFAPGGGGGSSGGGGSGFTFTQDTTPTPTRVGDTWFDTSTGAAGGTSWVAIDEGSGEKVWVQFAPGLGGPLPTTQFRRLTGGSQSMAGSAITFFSFTDAVSDNIGSIGNRAGGYFSIGEKGLYTVDVRCTWSTSWGPAISLAMDLCYSDNQGGSTTSIGTQAVGPTPWAVTDNTFAIDATWGVVGPGREYLIRVYNYVATMTLASVAVTVARVSARP